MERNHFSFQEGGSPGLEGPREKSLPSRPAICTPSRGEAERSLSSPSGTSSTYCIAQKCQDPTLTLTPPDLTESLVSQALQTDGPQCSGAVAFHRGAASTSSPPLIHDQGNEPAESIPESLIPECQVSTSSLRGFFARIPPPIVTRALASHQSHRLSSAGPNVTRLLLRPTPGLI